MEKRVLDGKRKCTVPGCQNLGRMKGKRFNMWQGAWRIYRARLCEGHYWKKREGKPMDIPVARVPSGNNVKCPHCGHVFFIGIKDL